MNSLDGQSRPALARGVRLIIDRFSGGPVLLFPEGVLPLDAATHDIVSRCTGRDTLDAIIVSLAGEYETDHDTLRRDVCECLEQLRAEMLVTVAP